MPISGHGWELLVERQMVQKHDGKVRTVGTYRVFLEGQPTGVDGMMCESPGPGDNQHVGNGKRVEPGTYPMFTQYGKYRTVGYSTNMDVPATPHMPGVRLGDTGNRVGILIHPAHPPNLYLSSIGCLNPAAELSVDEDNDFWESRRRVIELLDSLRAFALEPFTKPDQMMRIQGAVTVIDGEPE